MSEGIGRGPTRLGIALFQRDGTLVLSGSLTARIYRIADDPETNPAEGTLLDLFKFTARTIDTADHEQRTQRLHGPIDLDAAGRAIVDIALTDPARELGSPVLPAHDGAMTTIFTTMVDLPTSGRWGAQIDVETGGRTYRGLLVPINVLERTSEPMIGEVPPASKQPLGKDVANLSEIDSSTTPNPALHNMTVADAIASGKPTVVAFVTPAFCQTRFCGPVMKNVVVPALKEFGGRANVLHIEPVNLAVARRGALEASATFKEWNMKTEPFIFVLDRQGRVSAKFIGIIDYAEVKQALDAALAAK